MPSDVPRGPAGPKWVRFASLPHRKPSPEPQLPDSLTGYISDRTGYDYHHHAEVGSMNAAFVGDEVTDRFCVLGEAAEHVEKLHELAAAGVDQFNLYLMNGDEEEQLERYGREIVPRAASLAASA